MGGLLPVWVELRICRWLPSFRSMILVLYPSLYMWERLVDHKAVETIAMVSIVLAPMFQDAVRSITHPGI